MAELPPKRLTSPWAEYPVTYRAREMQILARWIVLGVSGSIVGLRGVGRSTLLNFLAHRPEVLAHYLTQPLERLLIVAVDLNNLPDPALATFLRSLLRAFYETSAELPPTLQTQITHSFFENRATTDPFLPQSALRELLFQLQRHEYRVVLVLDRFDGFGRMITPELGDTLIGLRDSFRDTLSYIFGIRQSLLALDALQLPSDLIRLLTTNICYVRPLAEDDALRLIARRTKWADQQPTLDEQATMLALTGGYPSLLLAVCQWWLLTPQHLPLAEWLPTLSNERSIQHCLQEIWRGLTQEEQQALSEIGHAPKLQPERQHRREEIYQQLALRGLCSNEAGQWRLFGSLFQAYAQRMHTSSRGAIWQEASSGQIYHNATPLLNLTPKEHAVLAFFIQHPKERHTYTDVIVHAWSDEERYHGVTNDSLFQVIRGVRQKIEPNPAEPVYIVNWRGKPEGGYLFYPEGLPSL
jgi:hypothetical protein